jgi:hypothetical protein
MMRSIQTRTRSTLRCKSVKLYGLCDLDEDVLELQNADSAVSSSPQPSSDLPYVQS